MHRFIVPGMTCGGCVGAVTRAVRGIDPQAEVTADVPAKTVAIKSDVAVERLAGAIQAAGFTVSQA